MSGTGASQSISYAPDSNYNGSDTFTVQVSDGRDGTDTITVNVTITAANDGPVITGDATATTPEDTTLNYHFTISDVEDTAAALTLTYTSLDTTLLPGANMSIEGSGESRILHITPGTDRTGTGSFTITLRDSAGASVTKTVPVTVTESTTHRPHTVADRTFDEDETAAPSALLSATSTPPLSPAR